MGSPLVDRPDMKQLVHLDLLQQEVSYIPGSSPQMEVPSIWPSLLLVLPNYHTPMIH